MSKRLKTIIKGIILGVSLGIVISATIAGVKVGLHGKLPAGTLVAGTDMSYRTPAEAVQILKEKEALSLSTPLEISLATDLSEKTIQISPQDIDIEYFITETIATIDRINLKENSLPQVLNKKRERGSAEVLYTFDAGKFTRLLDEKLALDEIAPRNATYFINEQGELDITEEKSGQIIDYDGAVNKTKEAIAQMKPVEITLDATAAAPSITKTDLENLKDEIIAKLKNPVLLTHDNEEWTITPIDHLDWIEFAEINRVTLPYLNIEIELESKYIPEHLEESQKAVTILVNENKLGLYLDEQIVPEIEIPVDPISIYQNEENEVIIDGKGQDGIAIQRGMLKKSLELAINNSLSEVVLHTKTILAPVTISKSLQDLGIKELLGVGHTSFTGSPPNRIHNIKTGANNFSGTLIAPDEEFSFNEGLGRVDATTGYKKELVITKAGTIPEYGGGLCQVSTTTYRAAIFSGLPITSRAPHSYAVSYYSQILGYGLDATIYLGGQDLKFLNDTPGHILIHSYVEDNHSYFKFYGTSDGRKVSLDGPTLSNYKSPSDEVIYVTSGDLAPGETKQVGRKHTGFDALWYRTITRIDGTSETEEIFSRYKATQEKWWLGPAPAPEPVLELTPELMIEPQI